MLGNYLHDCTKLGMRPFILSLLAGIWFVALNILNACTQPPAEVVFKTSPATQRPGAQQSVESIPLVDSAPVTAIQQQDLPPLTQEKPVAEPKQEPEIIQLNEAQPPVPVQKAEVSPVQRTPADPSITEIIETGEKLTLGEYVSTPVKPSPIPVQKQQALTTFIMPVQGQIVSTFGVKPGGLRNDGINIAASEGSPIKAVADGEVLYVNKAMKGYGSLLLVRHADGWISTYAHNKEVLVSQGAKVKQGDVIAYVGKAGSVTSPQLHFSLRKDKKPVDPERYLATAFAQRR